MLDCEHLLAVVKSKILDAIPADYGVPREKDLTAVAEDFIWKLVEKADYSLVDWEG